MEFHNCIGARGVRASELRRLGYTYTIVVLSEAEFLEKHFPNNALVVWPSAFTYMIIDGINDWIEENEKQEYVESYSFAFPLTMEAIADDWENARDLLVSIENQTPRPWASAILESYRIFELELHILNETFEATGIDVTDYGVNVPIPHHDPQARQIIMELYKRLDRDTQIQMQYEIPNLLADFRQTLRFRAWLAERNQYYE